VKTTTIDSNVIAYEKSKKLLDQYSDEAISRSKSILHKQYSYEPELNDQQVVASRRVAFKPTFFIFKN